MSTILIGIAGGTGSGKTTLTRHLKEHFGPEVTVIGHDNYYKRQDGKTLEERAKVNYDHPAAFDTELLIEHLKELKEGRPIRCPVYSYVEHNRTEETREILPTKVIIVEDILIFQNPTLRDMFDIKIFVETDADVRILRRALRDVEERGRTPPIRFVIFRHDYTFRNHFTCLLRFFPVWRQQLQNLTLSQHTDSVCPQQCRRYAVPGGEGAGKCAVINGSAAARRASLLQHRRLTAQQLI